MLDEALRDEYLNRRHYGAGRIVHAKTAIEAARAAIAQGKNKKRYKSGIWPRAQGMRGGATFQAHGESCVWMESPGDYMRTVGAAHDIARREGWRLDHKGWYCDDDGMTGETIHGIVYQLPAAKDHKPRYMIGASDPCNEGAALVAWGFYDDLREAMRASDSLAESVAEERRDSDAAWSAGRMNRESLANIRQLRRNRIRAEIWLGVVMAQQRRGACRFVGAAVALARSRLASIKAQIAEERRDIETRRESAEYRDKDSYQEALNNG